VLTEKNSKTKQKKKSLTKLIRDKKRDDNINFRNEKQNMIPDAAKLKGNVISYLML
jgi:phosphate starvation-inducible protein PhoH